ncbi:MAG: peptide deformylase [Verrucomicrobia bacterium]|nr:peptide deformylase [Verrucomicrobiota bacterium]MBI3866911.1 peptide deformylase [Verrucomicrobiota bacterium]
MILPIVKYGHPVLRQKGARVEKITPEIREFIANMLETMYDERGVGLAAQQVARALQITVIDVREATDRPSTMEIDGQPADINEWMPLVLINPEVKPAADPVIGGEGCLSFPEIFADIARPAAVDVTALSPAGKTLSFRAGGLLARAAQHETDHLHGILFIDRMTSAKKRELQPELDALMADTKDALARAPRPSKR